MEKLKLVHVPHMKLCSVNIILPIGTANDPEDKIGLSHLIEHLIFHSHPLYTQEEFMLKIEERGGIFNALTDRDRTVIYGRVQAEYVNEIILLFKEAIDHLSSSVGYIELEKKIIQNELRNPNISEYERMKINHQKVFYNDAPCSRNQFTDNNVQNITESDFLSFLPYYGWNEWNILIIGCIKENISKFQKHRIESQCLNFEVNKSNYRVGEYREKGFGNGLIFSIPISEELTDTEALVLLYGLFRGISSPFYTKIVKENGFTYSIDSSVKNVNHLRVLEVGWVCEKEEIEESKSLFLETLQTLLQDKNLMKQFLEVGVEKAKTEILLICENFLGYSSHLVKQVAIETLESNFFELENLKEEISNTLEKTFFKQDMCIGIYID